MKQDSIALSRLLKRFDMGSCKTELDCELANPHDNGIYQFNPSKPIFKLYGVEF